jgi:hypothetical protein
LVEHDVAPPIRPERVQRPEGEYPGGTASRQASRDVLRHAPDFMGLAADAALALARDRDLTVQLIDEPTRAITADYRPSRLNIALERGRVVGAWTD